MAENTPCTPVEMILHHADLTDEYESASTSEERDEIYKEAIEIYEKNVQFDEDGNLTHDHNGEAVEDPVEAWGKVREKFIDPIT